MVCSALTVSVRGTSVSATLTRADKARAGGDSIISGARCARSISGALSGESFFGPFPPLSIEADLCVQCSLARLHSRGTTTSSGVLLPMNHLSIPATWAVGEFTYLLPYGHNANEFIFQHCSIHAQGQPPPPYYAETQPSFCYVTIYPTSILPRLYPAYAQTTWIIRPGGDQLFLFTALTASVSFSHSRH